MTVEDAEKGIVLVKAIKELKDQIRKLREYKLQTLDLDGKAIFLKKEQCPGLSIAIRNHIQGELEALEKELSAL